MSSFPAASLAWFVRILCASTLLLALAPARVSAQCGDGSGTWTVGLGQEAAGPLGAVHIALPWDPDGAGPEGVVLVAAGNFRVAGTGLASNIATWNGELWAPMGEGLNGTVLALAVFNGELIAAGSFTASGVTGCNRIARWTGSQWQPLGVGLNGNVNALAVYNGRLYAGGDFTTAGGSPANAVASWDGGIWRSLGTHGTNGGGGVAGGAGGVTAVYAMAVFNGHLMVGGVFNSAGAIGTNALARWNGTSWSSQGLVNNAGSVGFGSSTIPRVHAMAVYSSSTTLDTSLYIGGDFSAVDGIATTGIARYRVTLMQNGPWAPLAGGLAGGATELLVQSAGPSSHVVYASSASDPGIAWPGGTYLYSSGVWNQYAPETASCLTGYFGIVAGVRGISRRVGSEWLPFGSGLDSVPSRVVELNGDLYAFGHFTVADQQVVDGAARLTDSGWQPVGSGLLNAAGVSFVADAEAFNGQIFIVGSATSAGGTNIRRVLRWNGTSWLLAGEFSNAANVSLTATGGNLYMTNDALVYRWSGQFWQSVGPLVPGGRVDGVVWWDGALHALGYDLYRLDGAAWQLVADNPSFLLRHAIDWNGRLFVTTSTQGPGSIVELVGSELITVVPGLSAGGFIDFGGRLITTSSPMAVFDGTDWSLTSEFFGIQDLAIHDGDLIVAGTHTVNGAASPIFARLVCCEADIDGDGDADVFDLLAYLDLWFNGAPAANLDGVPGTDVFDLLAYLDVWFAGC